MEKPIINKNQVFTDKRGVFAPLKLTYNSGELNKNWIQSNVSINPNKFTLRGYTFKQVSTLNLS